MLKAGGKVLGHGAPPAASASDFSSFLLQAQASQGARSSAWPTPAATRSTRSRQANEFGITKGDAEPRRPAGVHHRRPRAGPEDGAGPVSSPRRWYWDLNDRDARLGQALLRADEAAMPVDGAGRRLLGGAALPEGGRRRPSTDDGDQGRSRR
ncbi:MAG: hypothetical protein MZW92_66825 [Comamonadaceae bacterium]|nr:hypothetical protein [Comamonadaceae bacterium]